MPAEIGVWILELAESRHPPEPRDRVRVEPSSGTGKAKNRCNPDSMDQLKLPVGMSNRIVVADHIPTGLRTPCLYWTGARDTRGNARVKINGRTAYVRRALVEASGRILSSGDCVASICRNPACVSHEHHVIGTQTDARALGRKGRFYIGDLLYAKRAVSEGVAPGLIASNWQISEAFLTAAIMACEPPH